jgi:hypothetical protein
MVEISDLIIFLSKFALRYSSATIRFLKWKINTEREKLKLRNEEKNATIRHYDWRLPKVEEDLQDARRSLQDEKQSNKEEDGHIQLVIDQKKQHIQSSEVWVDAARYRKYITGTDRRSVRGRTVLSLSHAFNARYAVKYPFFAPILALCRPINFTNPII